MTKCIGRMPECQYFTTGGGCASPVNCLYKVEGIYSNSATSNTTCYVVYDKYLKQAEKELAEEKEQ